MWQCPVQLLSSQTPSEMLESSKASISEGGDIRHPLTSEGRHQRLVHMLKHGSLRLQHTNIGALVCVDHVQLSV